VNDEATCGVKVEREANGETVTPSELQEREDQYRSIFEATSDALVITDLQATIVEANPAACAAYGYAHDEIVGLTGWDLIYPDDHEMVSLVLQKLVTEHPSESAGARTVPLRTISLRKDGTSFVNEGYARRFTYRGEPHLMTVGRDITERVEAEALLEHRVEERTNELRTLLDVSQSVASTLELQPLLTLILDQLNLVVEHDGAALLSLQGSDLLVLARRAPGSGYESFPDRYTVDGHKMMWDFLQRGEPVIIDDVRGDSPMAQTYARLLGEYLTTAFSYERSFMAVPMMLKDRIVGLLSVSSGREGFYTLHHAELAQAIAQQAAIAIENARLYRQAQELAALEERQRLARELHDSVTQALFGINVAAHTARAQLKRDPEKAYESIEYLRALAQGGMAEMRALLFELRPESLESEGLIAAIRKQTQALVARHEIPINLVLCDEPASSLPVKEALYRITQEALNNTFKHARPTTVTVMLTCSSDALVLEVQDDGEGFETNREFPGHLGLRSMSERAARLGGTLEVESFIGQGTRVRAVMPPLG
jgi:PAS domain S-box-containing protein